MSGSVQQEFFKEDEYMKHVMVTDASGKLGRKIVADLLAANYRVTVVSHDEGAANTLCSPRDKARLNLLRCDLAHKDEVSRLAESMDAINVVIHVAGGLPTDRDDYNACTEQVNMSINLISFFGNRIDHAVISSSTSVYGDIVSEMVSENSPAIPTTYHGASQLASEKFWDLFAIDSGKPVTILRFARFEKNADFSAASRAVLSAVKADRGGLFTIYPSNNK
jgi:nucleoside-diphosphate-sugar epimerase